MILFKVKVEKKSHKQLCIIFHLKDGGILFSVCNPHTLNTINQFYIMHFSGSSIKITTKARQLGNENPAVVPSASISTPISGSPSF